MKFARHVFQPTETVPGAAQLCGLLQPGRWLVEAGDEPPPNHSPARLLAGMIRDAGMAISLSTATLLQTELAAALTQRLALTGCMVAPLATVALHEMVLNAAIHGNLGVASGASRAWGELSTRQSQIAAALSDPTRAQRIVTVALGWNVETVLASIADQGEGYDPSASDGEIRRSAGRGMMIARAVAKVEVHRGGRCVRLIFARIESVPPANDPAATPNADKAARAARTATRVT